MIDINNITVRIGSKVLLENASAHISDGQKVGLVGVNGCGKSTLFRVFRGELETELGDIYFPSGYKVVFVEQEIKDKSVGLLDFVLSSHQERTELLKRLETAKDDELAEIHERLRLLGAAAAPAEAASILTGLGFKDADLSRPLSEFSGGWQMRAALAAALFQPSDILLLDEPTNHLDLEAGIWLENRLQKYRGTLLIISHDRNILNSLCNYILHFDHRKLVMYGGNYDTFCRTRAMQKELLSKQAEKQEAKRKHLQAFVDRFRYKASKARQAQSRLKMLEKLEPVIELEDDAVTRFDFPEPQELPPPLLTLENGSAGYDGKAVLKRLNLQIVDNDRIALLGANGNGKSTLAKVLSGRLELMDGKLTKSSKLKIGYFAQHQAEELPLDMTPVEFMSPKFPDYREPQVRAYLARFGLTQEKALTRIDKLSGGEKARLLFAAMAYNAPEVLILDEPTNHLDIDGREALIRALNEYKGSVILIAHDMHLLELVADTLWLVDKGSCKVYDGDLADYRNYLLNKDAPAIKKVKKAPPVEVVKVDTRAEKKETASRLRRVEREIEKLEAQKTELEAAFASQLSTDEIISKQKDLAWISNQLHDFEEEWLELSEKLERL